MENFLSNFYFKAPKFFLGKEITQNKNILFKPVSVNNWFDTDVIGTFINLQN